MTLSIYGNKPHANGSIEFSDTAAERARLAFNPSGLEAVDVIKTLAAAFYTVCEGIMNDNASVLGLRESAEAMNEMQKAAMLAVSAATAPKAVGVEEAGPDDPEAA